MIFWKIICWLSFLFSIASIVMFFILSFVNKKLKISLLHITILVFILSFSILSCFLYEKDSDLSRYYELMEELKDKNFDFLFSDFKYKSTPITSIWFFIISKSGIYNLITFVPSLITLGIISFICLDIFQKKEIKKINYFCLVFLIIISFVEMIMILTTVRYMTAAAIVTLAIYGEVSKKRHWIINVLLYICGILIHNYVLLIVFIRILSLFNLKYFNVIFVLSYVILYYFGKLLQLLQVEKISKIGKLLVGYLNRGTIDYRFVICSCMFMIIIIFINHLNSYNQMKMENEKITFKSFFKGNYYKNNYLSLNYAYTLLGFGKCSHLIRRINLTTLVLNFSCVYDFFTMFDDSKIQVGKINYRVIKYSFFVVFIIIILGMFTYQIFGWKIWSIQYIKP